MQQLIEQCIQDEDKLYLCVSSPTIKDKPVQVSCDWSADPQYSSLIGPDPPLEAERR